jgi:hypothetical protein
VSGAIAQKFAAPRICSWLLFAADICNFAVKERSFDQHDLARFGAPSNLVN